MSTRKSNTRLRIHAPTESGRRVGWIEGPPAEQPSGTYAKFKDSEGNQFVLGEDR